MVVCSQVDSSRLSLLDSSRLSLVASSLAFPTLFSSTWTMGPEEASVVFLLVGAVFSILPKVGITASGLAKSDFWLLVCPMPWTNDDWVTSLGLSVELLRSRLERLTLASQSDFSRSKQWTLFRCF